MGFLIFCPFQKKVKAKVRRRYYWIFGMLFLSKES